MHTRMMNAEFPVSGQPIRIVVIDGEPWFVVMDVCRILGIGNPSEALRGVQASEQRRVNTRTINLSSTEGNRVSAGQNGYQRGNPMVNVVNESGLYRLIMRSKKPTARPFQDWVTGELLPAVRRGDADLGAQRGRMAETFAEAMDLGQPVASTLLVDDQGFEIRTDGSVHCLHGPMEPVLPTPFLETGPPFGVYFDCRDIERIGIRGSIAHRPCRRIHFVDIVRHLIRIRDEAPRPANPHLVTLAGPPDYVAEVLKLMGVPASS